MAGIILTPITLWSDFNIDVIPTAEIIDQKTEGEFTISQIFLEGRKVVDDTVRIYCKSVKKTDLKKSPAIILFRDFCNDDDEGLVFDLASCGYAVYQVDLAGEREGVRKFTEYPIRIKYANYEVVKDSLSTVKDEVRQTCWYEWCAVAKYVLKYLGAQEDITDIGGLAIGKSATVLWMLAGSEDNLACSAFVLNSGWSGYRGIHKFAGKLEPQFSDNMYKFIAGVEPQSYAMHVKCPTLVLSAPNSNEYDCDRASDTVSRIDKATFKAVNYSIGSKERINFKAYTGVKVFFERFLDKKKGEKLILPREMDVKCEVLGGKISIEVFATTKNLKNIAVYVSEEITNPALRCWNKITECKKTEEGFVFEYVPRAESEMVCVFAQGEYKNGFSFGSNIVSKKFSADQIEKANVLSNIIYSSRVEGMESIFCAYDEDRANESVIDYKGELEVAVNKGPMGMEGVFSKYGIMTYKTALKTQKPQDDAMLMFDYYSKSESTLTVKLIVDCLGDRIEYVCAVKCRGGDVWHNVKLERNRFKTLEGMSLKSFEKVQAIAFESTDEEWLINNALWV